MLPLDSAGRTGIGPRIFVFTVGLGLLLAWRAPVGWCQQETALEGHRGIVYSVAFSPDGQMLASGGADDTVKFWRFAPLELPAEELKRRRQLVADLEDDHFEVRQDAFHELKYMGREIQPLLVEALQASETTDARLRIRFLLAGLAVPVGVEHREEVRCVAFSPDSRMVASASGDNTIVIWSVASGRPLMTMKGHTDGVWAVAYSPDGKLLASGGGDHTIRIWSTADGDLVGTLVGHHSTIHRVSFSPDGRSLASAGSFDDSARIWDLEKQTLAATLDGHTDAVLCVSFSSDSKRLATSGYGGTVRIWRSDDGQLVEAVTTKHGIVRSVAFSPQTDLLATGGDRSVQLWNLSPVREVASFIGDSEQVYTVAFSPAGDRLASAGKDGVIRCWNLRK